MDELLNPTAAVESEESVLNTMELGEDIRSVNPDNKYWNSVEQIMFREPLIISSCIPSLSIHTLPPPPLYTYTLLRWVGELGHFLHFRYFPS